MLKLSSKRWRINSITKIGRSKLSTLPSKKEEQLRVLPSLTTFEVRSLNGKFGMAISNNSKKRTEMTRKMIKIKRKRNHMNQEEADTRLLSRDAWKLWKEWSDKIKKIENTTTTSIIGRKEKKLRVSKVSSFLYGDSVMKRKRNMLLPLPGTLAIKIFSPFPLEAMTSLNKKLVRFSSGLWKMSPSLSTSMKVYPPVSCVLIGILLLLLFSLLVSTTVQCLFTT